MDYSPSPGTFQEASVDRSKNVWQNPNNAPPQQGGAMIVIVKDCFQELFDLENIMEQHRKELSYQRDFTLIAAFNTFAKSMQQRVSLEEFSFGLDRLDFALLPSDIKLFFDRYDSDQDGKLGFWEFSNSLLPLDIRQRDDLENRQ